MKWFELTREAVIVLLEPMNSGYSTLFDTLIKYLSCYIQRQYTV